MRRKIQWHRALGLEIATALFEMKSWQKNAALISPQVALSSLHNCAPAPLVAAGNATSRILGVIREKSLRERTSTRASLCLRSFH